MQTTSSITRNHCYHMFFKGCSLFFHLSTLGPRKMHFYIFKLTNLLVFEKKPMLNNFGQQSIKYKELISIIHNYVQYFSRFLDYILNLPSIKLHTSSHARSSNVAVQRYSWHHSRNWRPSILIGLGHRLLSGRTRIQGTNLLQWCLTPQDWYHNSIKVCVQEMYGE